MRWNYFVCLALMTFACHSKTSNDSNLQHDTGRFLNNVDAFQWHAIDEATWIKHETEGNPHFTDQHPMVQRLQAWADIIRENMLKTTPQLSVAPRPIIRVIDSDEVNAYVAGIPVCVDVAMTTNPDSQAPLHSSAYFMKSDSAQIIQTTRPQNCETFQGDLEAKRNFVQWALKDIPDCKATILGSQLAITPACFGANSPYVEKSNGFYTYTLHNYVTFYRALIEKMSEAEIVSVVAHELGHYYMGHGLGDPEQYDYFYEMGSRNANAKPVPLPKGHALETLADAIRKQPDLQFVEVAGQEFHSLMFNAMTNLQYTLKYGTAETLCRPDQMDCLTRCQPFLDHIATHYDHELEEFPNSIEATDSAKAAYFLYESEAKACLAGLRAKSVERQLQSTMSYTVPGGLGTAIAALEDETALSLYARVSTLVKVKADAIQAEIKRLVLEGQKQGLGWYTTEQEADDIATEMVFRLGLDPSSVITLQFILGELSGESGTCREQYAQGFPVPVSIGNYNEPHHDSCYRAYNSYRELEVHSDYFARFKDNTIPVVQAGVSWESAVSMLKQVF